MTESPFSAADRRVEAGRGIRAVLTWIRVIVPFVALAATGCGPQSDPPDNASQSGPRSVVRGHVVSSAGVPLNEARVRVQSRPVSVLTNAEGHFELPVASSESVVLTAWKSGFFIGSIPSSQQPARIELRPLPVDDHAGYHWVDPTPQAADHQRCGNCHPEIFRQWQEGVHARSATNRRMLGLYSGTDWSGGQQTGWSLLDDHPLGASVCQSCHAPTLEYGEPGSDDLRQVEGVAALGVHCDFCHKVHAIPAAKSGLAHGRLAVQLLRPENGQLFFGPLDDVSRGEETFSPLLRESRFCATCHEGIVFGTHVYGTYSEWLESPARRQGRTCQSCHMQPDGRMTNMAPGAGGLERDPRTLASHQLLPGGKEAMLRKSVQITSRWSRDNSQATLIVTLLADHVGHRVPTGFVDRHLILCVEPVFEVSPGNGEPAQHSHSGQGSRTGTDGSSPDMTSGPRLPTTAGEPLSGRPGVLLGRILTDIHGNAPAPFWRTTASETDTRLFPGQPLETEYRFAAPPTAVRIRLLYRRFWQEVRLAKGWPDETLVIHDQTIRPESKHRPPTR